MPARKTFPSIRVRGNVQIDGDINRKGAPMPTFREYVCLMSQQGANAPAVAVLHNTLGGDVVWTRQSVGVYLGAHPLFTPEAKVIVLPSPTVDPASGIIVAGWRWSDGRASIMVGLMGGDSLDGMLLDHPVIIRVYTS